MPIPQTVGVALSVLSLVGLVGVGVGVSATGFMFMTEYEKEQAKLAAMATRVPVLVGARMGSADTTVHR